MGLVGRRLTSSSGAQTTGRAITNGNNVTLALRQLHTIEVDAHFMWRIRRLHTQQRHVHTHEEFRPCGEHRGAVQILVLSSARKRILEIGTSNGYSALWLASALRKIPQAQRLTTIEYDARKVQQARLNVATAGLSETITVREGSATDIVMTLPGPFDCVFFYADRISAPEQLHILLPKLERDVLLLADNVLSHPEEVAGYLKEFEHLPEFVTSTVTVGKGLHIAYRNQ